MVRKAQLEARVGIENDGNIGIFSDYMAWHIFHVPRPVPHGRPGLAGRRGPEIGQH
jgi:hypothetical protein